VRLLLALVLLLPQESQVRLRAGQEKVKVRDFDGALPEFEKCLELDPEEYNAAFGLGVCWWEKEDYRKSRGYFAAVVERVEKKSPGSPLIAVHQKLLGCALLLEDFDAAIDEATRLLKIQERAEYFYDRALARQRKGDLNGALEDCAAAVREDGQLTKARVLRAGILQAKGDVPTALDEYAAAIKARASDPGAPFGRGCARLLLGREAEALEDFRASKKANQGLSSDLELRAATLALIWLGEMRARRPEAAAETVQSFKAELKELGRDPLKNHLLCLPLYVAGVVSEAELLRAAQGAVCRPAQARCEAWFFVGERKLVLGDRAGAREAFRNCGESGARGIFEHDLALKRLQTLAD
jgi:tetratricopeptide (TPR) repeat protein